MAMHARVFQSALFRPCFTGAFLSASALASEQLSCCLLTSAACLLCHTWLCTALFAAMSSSALFDAIPFCPHALSWAVLRTYVSYPSTQSPDALFSIVLKPPTGVFLHTASVFSCSAFTFGVFQNADSAFFYPRPVVLNTDQGFPERRPVFSRGFATSARLFVPSIGVFGRGILGSRLVLSLLIASVLHVFLLLFLPIVSGIVPIHFPVTYAFPSHGGIRLSSLRSPSCLLVVGLSDFVARSSLEGFLLPNGPAALWWKDNRLPRGSGSLDRYMLIAA